MKIEIRTTKPDNIVQITTLDERWYQDPTTGEFFPSTTWITSYYPKGKGYERYLADKGWDEAERIKQEAGDRGTIVHHAIEKGVKEGEVKMTDLIKDRDGNEREMTPDEYYCVVTFHQWWTANGRPKPVEIERSLVSKKYQYGGTLDYLFENGLLLDIKTSKDVYPSHELQLSALKNLCEEKGFKVKEMGILQVGYTRNKNQHYKLTLIQDKFNLFLSARDFWKNENDGSKSFQRDYPLSVNFNEKLTGNSEKGQHNTETETGRQDRKRGTGNRPAQSKNAPRQGGKRNGSGVRKGDRPGSVSRGGERSEEILPSPETW